MMLPGWEIYILVVIAYTGIYFSLVNIASTTYTYTSIFLVADMKDTKIESLVRFSKPWKNSVKTEMQAKIPNK